MTAQRERPLCIICGRPAKPNGLSRSGFRLYKKHCSSCHKSTFESRQYRQHLGECCERCGFVPQERFQLDIHHRDEDRSNNDPSNLATLCANCHRLEHNEPKPL